MEKGLAITSSAPIDSTSTRSCSFVRAVTTMIGRRGAHSRTWRITCQPSTPGSIRSSTTASGGSDRRLRSPASPSLATTGSMPAARMWKAIASAVLSSSSTMSTRVGVLGAVGDVPATTPPSCPSARDDPVKAR